ncbi:unnamed protein product [Closterium sp. NIES-65]|nr:unnamed protein product [Closterium sp. NIES-65]
MFDHVAGTSDGLSGVRYFSGNNGLYREKIGSSGDSSASLRTRLSRRMHVAVAGHHNGSTERLKASVSKSGHGDARPPSSSKLVECFLSAKSYLTIADEVQDEILMERVKQEVHRCLSLLDQAYAGGTRDAIAVPEEARSKQKRKRPLREGRALSRLKLKLEAAEQQTKNMLLQSMVFSQIASRAIPQPLHCLSLRLTMVHSTHPKLMTTDRVDPRLSDPNLHHYALFSDNVVAVAVVVNSTASNAANPSEHVFHVITDRMNYAAMKAWFSLNPPRGNMALEVRSLDEYPWINASYVPVLRQIESEAMRDYYFQASMASKVGATHAKEDYVDLKYRNPKYLSILNHLRFYLPRIFPQLDKILFLDDDVVVQQDLTELWKIPMNGKVNLAVETCGKVFHRFKTYLNFSSPLLAGFDPEGCGWAFGMNMFNLAAWRRGNYTDKYHFWQDKNEDRSLWKLGTLPPGLLTFYNATEPLDKRWQVLGLGSKSTVDVGLVQRAAVIHYNGHAKPWLELAIPVYQRFWTRYVPYDNPLLQQCNFRAPTAVAAD